MRKTTITDNKSPLYGKKFPAFATNSIKSKSGWLVLFFTLAAAGGALLVVKTRRKKRSRMGQDRQFTGAYPRYSGAISAVTGGPPEDINEMPAVEDLSEGAIYDGTDLKRSKDKNGTRIAPS